MGLTIYTNKGHSIDMGYFGFNNLRQKIAELAGIGEHYDKLTQLAISVFAYKTETAYDEYDKGTERLIREGKLNEKVADFLYAPDTSASLSYGVAKELLNVIGDYDDNIIYGYAGRPDRAMFKDFKQILEDCVKNRTKLRWD